MSIYRKLFPLLFALVLVSGCASSPRQAAAGGSRSYEDVLYGGATQPYYRSSPYGPSYYGSSYYGPSYFGSRYDLPSYYGRPHYAPYASHFGGHGLSYGAGHGIAHGVGHGAGHRGGHGRGHH